MNSAPAARPEPPDPLTAQLAGAAFVDVSAVALGAAATLLLLRFGVSSTWLVLGAASGPGGSSTPGDGS